MSFVFFIATGVAFEIKAPANPVKTHMSKITISVITHSLHACVTNVPAAGLQQRVHVWNNPPLMISSGLSERASALLRSLSPPAGVRRPR